MRHPDGPEAVILDGIVPPDWTFAEFDSSMDTTGRDYLAHCDADPSCASHLGGDAVAFAESTLATLGTTPCGAFDASLARQALGALLLTGDDRAAIPAVLARLDRCSAEDEAALDHLLGTFPTEDTQNEPLLANIAASELWPDSGPSVSEAQAALDHDVMATGVSAWVAARAEQWPAYALDGPDAGAARPSVPALLLHGGLDPTVLLARNAAARTAWPLGQSVTPPGAGHVTLNFSNCAADAYVQFLDDPANAVVDDCTDESYAEDFDLSAADATRLFGQAEGWPG